MECSCNWKDFLGRCADTILRLGMGGMFIYSAWEKLQDPGMFQTAVDGYRMLPAGLTAIFAVAMPMAELLVGAAFIFTKWTREAAVATAAMLAMFMTALAQAYVRGLDISCGCFGETTESGSRAILSALVRDMFLLSPTVWLLLMGQRRWIVDFRRRLTAGSPCKAGSD